MKNILNYYYHLVVNELHQSKKMYMFCDDKYQYVFMPFIRSLEEAYAIYLLNIELVKANSFYHQIILNKNHQMLTYVNQTPYVLLRIVIEYNRFLNFSDLQQSFFVYPNQMKQLYPIFRFDWLTLWKDKIDYFEYQINHFQNKYPLLVKSISYFIGLGETAISYIQSTFYEENELEKETLVISHRRTSVYDSLLDFYNPLNIIIDYKVRDIAEYLKSCFYHDNYDLKDIEQFILTSNLSRCDCRLLYGRLLFPCFYFDVYDDIINGYQQEIAILKITSKISEYERFLYDIYKILNKYANIPSVTWVTRLFEAQNND